MTANQGSHVDRVQDHLQRYLRTGGQDGHIWNGVPTLLLTTTGRRTGKKHTTPLIYGRDGDRYLVVASQGDSGRHPHWYRNLLKNPSVEVQVMDEKFAVTARTASEEERRRFWPILISVWPAYEDCQARTEGEIPIVILERV